MDVQRFEDDLAALSPDHRITPLNGSAISRNLVNGYIGTWTLGIEQKIRSVTVTAGYIGTAGVKLTALDQPNGYTGATPEFAAYTNFDSAGEITGGFGPIAATDNHSHSTYHGLQVSASNNLTPWGLGVQASLLIAGRNRSTTSAARTASRARKTPFTPGWSVGPRAST